MRHGSADAAVLLIGGILVVAGCQAHAPDDTPGESCSETPWYPDSDGDGWGDEYHPLFACVVPAAYVDQPGDCDDASAAVHPAASEECDGVDNDCNGEVDESTVPRIAHLDADGDGHGHPDVTQLYDCFIPDGYVAEGDDCDDTDPAIHPGAAEALCDGVDADCDGEGTQVAAVIADIEYDTIQAAIDAALAGSTLQVCPGTHTEALEIPDFAEVALEGFSGTPDDTLLDGQLLHTILVAGSGSAVTLSRLTFRNGMAIYNDKPTMVYSRGGAVHSCGDVLVIEDCRFEDNSAVVGGGAVQLRNLPVVGCGHDTVEQVTLSIADSVFEGSFACNSDGGAIAVDLECDGEVTIAGTEIRDNQAGGEGGGVFVRSEGDLTLSVRDSSFEANEATTSGGGLQASAGEELNLQLSETTFVGNVTGSSGAGLQADAGGILSVQIAETSFMGNTAGYQGGAIYLEPGQDVELSIADSSFEGNESDYHGGALAMDGNAGALVDIAASSWTDQIAGNDGNGGAISLSVEGHIDVTIADSSFLRNHSTQGGGAIHSDADSASLALDGCEIADNTSDHDGAGLLLEAISGEVSLSDCALTSNVSSNRGGAICTDMPLLDLVDVHLSDNSATDGGAIYQASSETLADLSLGNCWVTGNSGGGVFLSDDSVLHSETTDWGSGVTDNDPYDIDTNDTRYTVFTTGEAFTCESSWICY